MDLTPAAVLSGLDITLPPIEKEVPDRMLKRLKLKSGCHSLSAPKSWRE
jgi:hypothetical protein